MPKTIKNIRKISNIPPSCRERYLPLTGKSAQPLLANGINFSGISNLRSGYEIGHPEPLSRHMIIFTKAGDGYLHTDERRYRLTGGTVISIPQGIPLTFGVCKDQWDILWFYMLDIPYWQVLKKKGIEFRETEMIPKIETAMEGFLAETQAEVPENRAAYLFAELSAYYLDQALGINQESIADEIKSKLDQLWQQVLDNPAGDWSKQQMASQLHVAPATFDRMVKKYYGITPWQKVIQIRMEQAKIILKNTHYPLQVIAERLGYANEFVFSSAFKNHTGLSPKFYRHKKSLQE